MTGAGARRGGGAAAAALALALPLAACGERASRPHDGPIVLVTFAGLRADVVGGLGGRRGLTPHLDELIREADWAGRAVAPSSWLVPAMASLWTGLQPWHHQALHGGRAGLHPDLLTLPEALQAAGYRTHGFRSAPWLTPRHGYGQGLDAFPAAGRAKVLADCLARLDGGRELVWIHVPEPQAPYVRRDWLLPRGGRTPEDLPERLETGQLERHFDPARRLTPGQRRRIRALYLVEAAWADERLGRLLEALRRSGQWDRTLLAVVATHGQELGERGQTLEGGNLGRRLLEVPLVVKLPAGSGRRIAVALTERVAAVRLWATLVEAAGGPVPPAAAPSLFRDAPGGILSELYLTDGTNHFSWLEGDLQLLEQSRFAPSEPEYYRARLRPFLGAAAPPTAEPPRAIMARLEGRFAAAPPLTGDGAPRRSLERWDDGAPGGSRPAAEAGPPLTTAMAERLAAAWGRFLPAELTPAEEAREWPAVQEE